ncbi:MAG: hypothetical protein PVG75_15035 [Thioalkalispiraceae bacterium]|jgi:hypothetical protein
MKPSIYSKRKRLVFLLVMIALASLAVRALIGYRFHESALLYVGLPFAIALILILLRPVGEVSWKRRYLIRLMDAFIIMFGSSVVLFEGFVCVAMFIPIYLLIMLLMFTFEWFAQRAKQKGRKNLSVHLLPVLVLFSSMEGITPQTSFKRDESVSVTRLVPVSIAEIKHNLQQPMDLQTSRPWFLHLFPMPYAIEAGSLKPGDIHQIHFRYYRWFVTNLHEGKMLLEISAVEDERIKTTFLEDSSYFSNYLQLKGTEITLEEVAPGQTRVTLRIDYRRTLDPYWYFAPVSRYGVSKTAEFLITEVLSHDRA